MNKTTEAIYKYYEQTANTSPRPHLGASVIGQPCSRKLFYIFRWAKHISHTGQMLRIFQRGQLEEKQFIIDLRSIGIKVIDIDVNTGEQYKFSDLGGHFGGSMDAAAIGFVENPHEWHVVEFKTFNTKAFSILKTNGIKILKPCHYAQVQCYMHWSGMTNCFYLAVDKDNDNLYSEFIPYNGDYAKTLIGKAYGVITATQIPLKLNERSEWWECKMCEYRNICHYGEPIAKNCRTCKYSKPVITGYGGLWHCQYFDCNLSVIDQERGNECDQYVTIPISA